MMHHIFQGSVYHTRLEPSEHAFSYPVFFIGVDLDLPLRTRLLRRNRRALFSLHDHDYLNVQDHETLAEAARRFLGTEPAPASIQLITVPRVLGRVFNPVSFYLARNAEGVIIRALAEVNNTFGERHVYRLIDPVNDSSGNVRFTSQKVFHVSPFNNREGRYHFRIKQQGDSLAVHVDLERAGRIVFKSGLVGQTSVPLNDRGLLRCTLRYPLQNLLTLPRIHWQAAKLYLGKKLVYYPKPGPSDPMTIKISPPTPIERFGKYVFDKLLARLQIGELTVTLPDGLTHRYGNPATGANAAIHIKDYTFYRRVLFDGDIGLGEAYMYDQWDSPDLTAFIAYIITNRDSFEDGEFHTTRLKRFMHRITHLRRSNTREKSPENIGAHYDLSNEFFALFLDPTLMYSSAVFDSPHETLEDAQHRRMKMLIDKLDVSPDHHVLEIGSGWGGFAIELARTTGCRVTSITVSREQLILARERVAAAGLQDRVNIEFCDYRDVTGSYDRVVSIEMLEAVGHEHFDDYFRTLGRALNPGGRAVVQVITIPHERYEAYSRSVDWIQKYIFPGGHLPSLEAMKASMARTGSFAITATEDIGPHYATTLRRWSENLAAHRDTLTHMGYDTKFYRTWQYYFSYCEAAFATRTLSDHILTLEPS